ncbi:MAG: hypothetical protein II054_01650 [Treponema sp.]|nr:hypothetical protein [Treponema sp.]
MSIDETTNKTKIKCRKNGRSYKENKIMTNEEMKEMLVKGGASVADVEKAQERFDADKITEIVEAANSPEEAFENLHAFYPELEVKKLQEQCDFIMEQVEASFKEHKQNEPMELTESELEMVAGGGFWGSVGNWFKKNWKTVAIVAAGVVIGAVTCGAGGAVIAAMDVATTTAMQVGCAVGLGITGGIAGGIIGHKIAKM